MNRRRLARVLALSLLLGALPAKADPPVPLSPSEVWDAYRSGAEPPARGAAETVQRRELERQADAFQATQTRDRAATGALGMGLAWMTRSAAALRAAGTLQAAYDHLTPGDRQCEPDTSPAGMPQVPTACCAEDAGCQSCYQESVTALAKARLTLEKVRCIYGAQKAYVDAALAFGDNTSGVHAVSGMAWQEQRARIVGTFKEFSANVDAKYAQILGQLEGALRAFGSCEERFCGEADWYARFGFIYATFMRDRYKR